MSSGSPAAEHVLAVLDFLYHGKGPVPAATISRTLGIPRSTTYQLLEALSARGFATHFPDDRTWGLVVRAFEIGSFQEGVEDEKLPHCFTLGFTIHPLRFWLKEVACLNISLMSVT